MASVAYVLRLTPGSEGRVATIETRFIPTNGISQHVALAGPADARPVLLIHGLGWDHSLWHDEFGMLAAAGWRVIAPDLRGMGKSDKPDEPYSIGLYVADLLALLDALAIERVAVVGFSLGGMIALALAARVPARIGAALIACASAASTPEGAQATEAMLARALKLGPRRFAEEQAQAIWSREWARDHPAEVRRFIAWRAGMDQGALARAFRASHGVDLGRNLARVTAPVRVVVAAADSFVSVESGRALAEALPDADLVVVERAGHMVSIERPEEFRATLRDFLDRNWPPVAALVKVGAPA
jgi:pimeloyl-ACP methyl ester carboxylesterase